uniref:Uncharacterized protein n=1 Tax=Arundo donax TaxID=35708 RepID=A0A0A9E558_ARUDO
MMKAVVQGSPDLGLDRREQRRKRSTDQGPSTPAVIVRRKEVQFGSLNSLGSKELDTVFQSLRPISFPPHNLFAIRTIHRWMYV